MVARSPRLNFSPNHGARAKSCRTSHAPVKAAPESPLTSIARPSFELRTRAAHKARIANGRLDAEWILTKWQQDQGLRRRLRANCQNELRSTNQARQTAIQSVPFGPGAATEPRANPAWRRTRGARGPPPASTIATSIQALPNLESPALGPVHARARSASDRLFGAIGADAQLESSRWPAA